MSDFRTVDEAYSSAGNADDLTVKADRRGEADVLIAAGLTPGLLGSALLRLHSEWDGAAKPRKLTETDARLLFGALKTLPKVIEAVGTWAAKRGYSEPYELAGGAVAYWLDDGCNACQGRGFDVIPGTPTLGAACKRCGGSGKRKPPGGEAGRAALNMMDDCIAVARSSMRLRLRNTMS